MQFMAFQGKQEKCEVYRIKDFEEKYDKSVKNRICNIEQWTIQGWEQV